MPKILIVDDERAIATMARLVLEKAGYAVSTAWDACAAMELCASEQFDLLLSDVRMPGINGHELARWVAVNYPKMRTLLMSGYDLQCLHCPYSPRCGLLHKPFGAEQLVEAVASALA